MKSKFLFVLLTLSFLGYSQEERKIINGKVITGLYPVKDALVVNVSAQREVRTDSLGFFTLPAREGDSVAVSDFKIIQKDFFIEAKHINGNLLIIPVESSVYELEEVVINEYAHINSLSLGIIQHDIVLPTVAERRLAASGSGDPLGALINVLSGRNKMLKRDVETEKKIMALDQLDYLFEDSFFVDDLKIQKELIKSFKYFAIEDKELREVIKVGEVGLIKFKLADLVKEFLNTAISED